VSPRRYPVVSADELISALGRLGYAVIRRKPTHIRLNGPGNHKVTVPDYKEVALGTLASILKSVSQHTQRPVEEIIELLE
jgi:predicted RNA binding protein YcfA (HicA-like mRNA interferase family)